MTNLYIKKPGIVKGVDTDFEMYCNKFVDMLKKDINKYYYSCDDHLITNIEYKVEVSKINENQYKIVYNYSFNGDYNICTEGSPSIARELDKLCDITKKHKLEEESYSIIKKNNNGTTKNYLACLEYLKKVRKGSINRILSLLSLLPISAFQLQLFYYLEPIMKTHGMSVIPIIMMLSAGAPLVWFFTDLTVNRSILKNIKINKLFKKEIKEIEKKLSSGNIEKISYCVTNSDNNDKYKDAIIGYINSIKNAAVYRLDDSDKEKILVELMDVLTEYTKKCKKINVDNQIINEEQKNVLTLDSGKDKIVWDTLNKLTEIEMKVANMINKKEENKNILDESQQLMEQLNRNLEEIENKKIVSAGKR